MLRDLVVIPARWGSTRFPGKPLASIAGRSLLHRVIDRAQAAIEAVSDVDLLVATDDRRIADHAAELGCRAVMTDPAIATGSGRALAALEAAALAPRFVVNLQGDAPFFPLAAPAAVLQALRDVPAAACVTPVVRLAWDALDRLREHKRTSPFSGTTCLVAPDGRALWFSKAVLPLIRNEEDRRASGGLSPVHQHVGIYGFTTAMLAQFEALPPSTYEMCEGLEQLRLLEAGLRVHTVAIDAAFDLHGGIDTREDVDRAERWLADRRADGEP